MKSQRRGIVGLQKFWCMPIIMGVCIQGCGPSARQTDHILSGDFSNIAVKAGEGFDSLHVRLTDNTCLDSQVTEQNVSAIEGFIEKVDDLNQVKSRLGYTVEGEFAYGLASGSAKASMLAESESTGRSVSFLVYRKVVSKVIRAMNPSTRADFEQTRCGDKYVNSVAIGAEFSVLVKLVFSSQKMKSQFDGEASGSYGSLGSLKATISQMSEKMRENSTILIKRVSTGEHLETLGGIFSGQDFVTCSMQNFGACENVLASLVEYTEGSFNQSALASTTVIDFDLREYPVGGISGVPESVLANRRSLSNSRESYTKDLMRVEDLTSSKFLNDDEKSGLSNVRNLLRENMDLANRELLKCFSQPNDCRSNPGFRAYDREVFGAYQKSVTKQLSASHRGVTDCDRPAKSILKSKCEEFSKELPGETLSASITRYGPTKSEESSNIVNGRKCYYEYSDATCTVEFKL